jgi:hypothetical protein
MTAPVTFTMIGQTFEARPLSDPPEDGAVVFLLGCNRLCAVATFGEGKWEIVHERFPDEPTHWVVPKPSFPAFLPSKKASLAGTSLSDSCSDQPIPPVKPLKMRRLGNSIGNKGR